MSVFTADRDLTKLIPDMRKRVERFLKACRDRGKEVFVTEAYRSQARQNYLYTFGRFGENKDKGKVTWTLNSNHTKGLSVDIAFQKPGNIYQGPWEDIFDIAEEFGLKSLYRQTGYDKPHLDFDEEWLDPKGAREQDQHFLIDLGLITVPKDIDLSPNREELYAILKRLYKKLDGRIKKRDKTIRELQKKLKELEKRPL